MKFWIVIAVAVFALCGYFILKASQINLEVLVHGPSDELKAAAARATGDIGEPPLELYEVSRSSLHPEFSISPADLRAEALVKS